MLRGGMLAYISGRDIIEDTMHHAEPEPDYRALSDFRYSIRRFLRFSSEAAAEAGLEPQQHQLMLAIKAMDGEGPATVGALADRLLIRHHSCVGLIDRLLKKGYVERQRDEKDRRRVIVTLTPAGEQVLHDLSVHHRAAIERAAPALVNVLNALVGNGDSEAAARALEAETPGIKPQ